MYLERIMDLLDENPGKEFTVREIEIALEIEHKPWMPSLYRALRAIGKMDGYTITFKRGAGIRTNHITALYSSNVRKSNDGRTNPRS